MPMSQDYSICEGESRFVEDPQDDHCGSSSRRLCEEEAPQTYERRESG